LRRRDAIHLGVGPSGFAGRTPVPQTAPVLPDSVLQEELNLSPDHPLPPLPDHSSYSEVRGEAFQPFLPEQFYLAATLPSRSRAELLTFRIHCRSLLQRRPERHIDHPFTEFRNFTPHPVVFKGFLWKYRTTVTSTGILEDYRKVYIDTTTRASHLIKAFTLFTGWDDLSYTITVA